MHFFDSTKSIIENLYFLSGLILALSLSFGIIQIMLTKKTLKINSKRSAANLAADQIKIYCDKIINMQNRLFSLQAEKKIPDMEIEVGEFRIGYLKDKLGEDKFNEIVKQRLVFTMHALDIFNSMEAFAIYFTKGVADEEIAYSSIGRTYCFVVRKLYFDIASTLADDNDKSFSNLIELFTIWNNRLKNEKLSKEKEKLLSELDCLKMQNIKPIGTE